METPEKFLRSMLEIPSGLDTKYAMPDVKTSVKSDRGTQKEGLAKAQRVYNNLKKQLAYWNDKCLQMRLALQKEKFQFKEEKINTEAKNESEIAELRVEIEESLKDEQTLKAAIQAHTQELEALKAQEDTTISTADLLQAVKGMKSAEVQFIHYQLYSMLSKIYKPYYPY
eukprot:TRINITY_DN2802_c0_g2_i1.p1 TRINITY_DN2802_c0_g2~~TRINITY_DN2802_c0_g2_i1.p1  ORF type:complete len:170 (+),score=51.18 TRINITY_DN2802_c0_g2_i1:296-805(+)